MSERRGGLFALGFACLLLLARAALATPLTLAVARTPLSLPLYVAEAEGYFADAGLATKLVDCSGGHLCLKLLLDGGAELATASDSVAMFRSFERDDFVILATFVTSSNDVKLVGRKDAGIARPAQLAGRRVGVVRGASSQFFLDSYLLLHGVDPRSLQLVSLQPDEMVQALAAGKVDAISAWEPSAFAAVAALGGKATVLPPSGVYALSFNLTAPRRLAAARRDEFARLLGAVQRAEALIEREPARAQAILRARLGVDQRFVDWVWPGLEFRLGLDQALLKTLESEARWALREGHVPRAPMPDYLRFIDPAPLAGANPTAVGLAR
jgi:NitT/TauT family transport system substrate-binding protein